MEFFIMKIGEHDVSNVKRNSAKVGCTTVTRDEVQALLKQMDEIPEKEFPPASRSNAIDACREKFDVEFLHLRTSGNYKDAGFFLGEGWDITIDGYGYQVLVRSADIKS